MDRKAAETERVELVACGYCTGPMVRGAGKCSACGTPEGGKEYPYIYRNEARPEVAPLFKWWGIWTASIWVLAGFSLGKTSALLITAVAIIYLVRITRRWFST